MKREILIFSIVSVILLVTLSACVKNSASLRGEVGSEPSQEELDLLKEIEEIERQLEGGVEVEEEVPEPVDEVLEEIESIESEPVEDTSGLQKLSVKETELAKIELNLNDADNDNLSISFSSPLNNEGQWQTDYGDAGEYVVTVTVSDGVKETRKKILLAVEKTNVAPEILGLSDITVQEGEAVSLDPQLTDLNNDPISVAYSPPLDDQGVWATDFTSAGVYEIVVTASDGEATTEKKLTLTVSDLNQPPILSGFFGALNVEEGELVTLNPVAEDLDGDEVTITISEPVGEDGEWQTTFTDHGEYVVTITADDGKDIVSEEVLLTVTDVNQAPEIIDITLG